MCILKTDTRFLFLGEFPGGLVVRIPGFCCRGPGSIPGWGTESPQAAQVWLKKKKKGFLFLLASTLCEIIN